MIKVTCSYNKKYEDFLVEVFNFVLTTYAQDLDLSALKEVILYKQEEFYYQTDGRTVGNGTIIVLSSRLFELLPCIRIKELSENSDFNLIVSTLYHEMGHVNDWLKMPTLYNKVMHTDEPQNVMAILLWLEYIAEKRSCIPKLTQKAHTDFCEAFIKWEWPAKDFNYIDANMNNYFYLVKAIPYFLARSCDPQKRTDYLSRMRNPIVRSFALEIDKEISLLENRPIFDYEEPLEPLSSVIRKYRQVFLLN